MSVASLPPGARAWTLRPLEAADVPLAQALTASFGWPHRRRDWAMMLGLGEGVAASDGERLAGTAVCWRFGPDWATMGLIGVDAALQGQGIGRRMMEALMDGLGGRSLVLHATRAGLPLYTALGFEPTGTTLQYQGAVAQPGLLPLPAGLRLRPAGSADLSLLASLDRAAGAQDRSALLTVLLAQPGGVVLDGPDGPLGFALTRGFGRGQLIGPVVAADEAGARAMIAHLLGQRIGQFARLDIPKDSALAPWLTTLGLEDAGTVIRMVRGKDAQPAAQARVFALASQAWG
ncbi:MAG: GNAT family N-acetyltransferase [Janthinobacterium lividum]